MPTEPELAELLSRVALGDRNALRAVYLRQSTRLFGIAMAILRDRNAAADVLQDAFLRVWERAGSFDLTRNGQYWLDAVVRYAALDVARVRGREIPTDDPTLGDKPVENDVLDVLSTEQDNAALHRCLQGLEPKNRDAIILGFVHGLSHPEIATRLDLPLGTVKSWIRRGLIQLRTCMDGEGVT